MEQGEKLNVIALISGGKDSLYSIAHCLRNGHEVIALGNLHPPTPPRPGQGNGKTSGEKGEDDEEDMDSFMYQTIGHGVVPLYEEALGIPLYRDPIRGRALNAEREYSYPSLESTEKADEEYGGSDGDETESLSRLLRRIMQKHPAANAVSAGAILSTYQRTRIENVAARLGLVPLAWLWMYPCLSPPSERAASAASASVTGLLDDMAAAGCEARVVKVASGGLESADVLWGDLAGLDGRVRRALVKTMGRFLDSGLEAAVLGEGGEYESLALDGPAWLWRKRIVVDEVKTVMGEAGVMSARIKGARCAPKEMAGTGEDGLSCIRRPELFDEEFYKLVVIMKEKCERIHCSSNEKAYEERGQLPLLKRGDHDGSWTIHMSQSKGHDAWYVTNCSAPEAGTDSASQMHAIVEKVRTFFQSARCESNESVPCADDTVFTTILLRSMSDFAAVNAIYSSLFVRPTPPARVTVACGDSLPAGVSVVVSLVIDTGPRASRHGLHVQSRSYWAPANIGPYSQAIRVPLRKNTGLGDGGGLVYVAGQIPLEPPTMELARPLSAGEGNWVDQFISHAALSLQHLWRIGRAMGVDWWLGGIAFLSKSDEKAHFKASIVADMWNMMNTEPQHDGEDDPDDCPTLDPWDIKYGRQQDPARKSKTWQPPLPNFSILSTDAGSVSETSTPPLFTVQVDQLPRGTTIEWQSLGTRTPDVVLSHEDRGDIWITRSRGSGFDSFTYIGVRHVADGNVEHGMTNAMQLIEEDNPHEGSQQVSVVIYTPCRKRYERTACQIVPCESVFGSDGRELIAGIVVHARPG